MWCARHQPLLARLNQPHLWPSPTGPTKGPYLTLFHAAMVSMRHLSPGIPSCPCCNYIKSYKVADGDEDGMLRAMREMRELVITAMAVGSEEIVP